MCLCSQYHEVLKTAIEIHTKHLLDEQRIDMWLYIKNKISAVPIDKEQYKNFERIFSLNNICPIDFANKLKQILSKSDPKINSLRIFGAPNTCKSLIANCIVNPFVCCYMNNHGSENEFALSNLLNKSIVLCEELYITIATAEDFKSVLGGQPIDISKKYNEKQLLSRTPIIITSNYQKFGRGHISSTDENALCLRCHNFVFNYSYKPDMILDWRQFYLFIESKISVIGGKCNS